MPYLADGVHPYDDWGHDLFSGAYDRESHLSAVMEGVYNHRFREIGPSFEDLYVYMEGTEGGKWVRKDDVITYHPVVTSGKNLPTRVVEWFIVKNGHITGSQDFSTPFSANEQTTKVRGGFLRRGPIGIGLTFEFALPKRSRFFPAKAAGFGYSTGLAFDNEGVQWFVTDKYLIRDDCFKLSLGVDIMIAKSFYSNTNDIFMGESVERNTGFIFGYGESTPYFPETQPFLIHNFSVWGLDLGWSTWQTRTYLSRKLNY